MGCFKRFQRPVSHSSALLSIHTDKLQQRFFHSSLRYLPCRNGAARLLRVIFFAMGCRQNRFSVLHQAQQKRRIAAIRCLALPVIAIINQIGRLIECVLLPLAQGIQQKNILPIIFPYHSAQKLLVAAIAGNHRCHTLLLQISHSPHQQFRQMSGIQRPGIYRQGGIFLPQ